MSSASSILIRLKQDCTRQYMMHFPSDVLWFAACSCVLFVTAVGCRRKCSPAWCAWMCPTPARLLGAMTTASLSLPATDWTRADPQSGAAVHAPFKPPPGRPLLLWLPWTMLCHTHPPSSDAGIAEGFCAHGGKLHVGAVMS